MRKTWLKFDRDDLHGIPFMEFHGFTPEFSYKDKNNGRIKPDCIPTDPVSFVRGDIYCWKSFIPETMYREDIKAVYNWQTAKLVDGYFTEHIRFNTLEEIIKHYL